MLRHRPDFFIIQAIRCTDGPIASGEARTAPSDRLTRKSKPAERWPSSADENDNLLDQNVRAFNAQVPMFAQWMITR
jgi:alkaline phosphatase D